MRILQAARSVGDVRHLKTPAIISFMLVLPFMILELVYRRNLNAGFPVVLFAFMWLLALSFMFTLMPILQSVRGGNRNMLHPASVLPRIAVLMLVAALWLGLVLDQMPCFLGVPNCD